MSAGASAPAGLAPWAAFDDASRGRRHGPAAQGGGSPFVLDRQRIVHCTAFRRLEYKTQVFVTHEGDHFRTRLTHTLEVAHVARRLAEMLGLNARLSEAVALAHDLGHPPFGHAGEAALAQRMRGSGGYEHNRQSLRVVDFLEHPYPGFRGLDLSFEVREGLLKHQTLYDRPDAGLAAEAPELAAAGPQATLEAQVVNIADELAYTLHDIEDGLMHGLLTERQLTDQPTWAAAARAWRQRYPDVHVAAIRRPILDEILEGLLQSAARATATRVASVGVRDVAGVRRLRDPLVNLGAEARQGLTRLQDLLRQTVYGHADVERMDGEARAIVLKLFDAYEAEPSRMPRRYVERVADQGIARVVCDYIAGMTDRYCRSEYEKWCT